jgi:hypothetical protein
MRDLVAWQLPQARIGSAIAALLTVVANGALGADAFPDTVFFHGFEPCVGVQCFQVHCAANQTTSVSGTVYAPNGMLPLPNVEVYVPNASVADMVDGPNAPRCDVAPTGHPLVATLTDANGNFTLANVPATTAFPLVLLAGKWRRQITVASVPQCTDTPLDTTQTRMPKNHTEGDIAHIALATGAVDTLECLLRKVGIEDTEFSTSSGSGRVHLFAGTSGSATHQFSASLGGAAFASASALWASSASLSAYDQVMLGCDGIQNPGNAISANALAAMETYANAGGRVYLAHLHNYWLQQTANWASIAGWANLPFPPDPLAAQVANDFPQVAIEYAWLVATGATPVAGSLSIHGARQTAISIDGSIARRWISATANSQPSIQLFTFTTPVGEASGSQEGRVLFTDMHAYVADQANQPFPTGCASTALSAQEQALIYATFDLQRCVGTTME